MFNAKEQKEKVVEWIREWFQKNGPECNAFVGISGGKDSSVVAALCVEALGCERVFGVMMQDGHAKDAMDAWHVCQILNLRTIDAPINEATKAIRKIIRSKRHIFNYKDISEQTRINLPPRVRMTVLYAFAQTLNGRVANTCNLSEDYIGYSTKYGDAAGDFAPLKSFTSEEVIAIGRELGLPENLLTKPPADGLCGKTDEDNLGFTYAVLNRYIRTGEIDDMVTKAKIDKLHRINAFKEKVIERYIYVPDGKQSEII